MALAHASDYKAPARFNPCVDTGVNAESPDTRAIPMDSGCRGEYSAATDKADRVMVPEATHPLTRTGRPPASIGVVEALDSRFARRLLPGHPPTKAVGAARTTGCQQACFSQSP